MLNSGSILGALECLRAEGVIAYPTEAVFGLGCDPRSQAAIDKVLAIKSRPIDKGLILIGSKLEHFDDYCDWQLCSAQQIQSISQPNLRPTTWVVPAKPSVSTGVRGRFDSVAIRITSHRVVRKLCQEFSHCIISTSANLASQPAITQVSQLQELHGIDFLLNGALGDSNMPSQIIDLLSGKILRS